MKPQLENGYTKIANELLEAICAFRIPGEIRQVLDCIIRKTYGFNKNEDKISNSQFMEMTGLKKQNVSRSLSKLITNRVVINTDNKLRLNKNYKEWISFNLSSKLITTVLSSKLITGVIKTDDKLSSELMTTKERKKLTKEKRCLESLQQCDEYCFWEIGKALGCLPEYVKKTVPALLDYIPDHPRKYKSFHRTLRNWVRMGMERGNIPPLNELEIMSYKDLHPDRIKELIALRDRLIEEGEL